MNNWRAARDRRGIGLGRDPSFASPLLLLWFTDTEELANLFDVRIH